MSCGAALEVKARARPRMGGGGALVLSSGLKACRGSKVPDG